MSLSERLATAESSGINCATCRWKATLPKKERQAFDDWAAGLKAGKQGTIWSRAELLRESRAMGLNVGRTAFADHLRDHQ